MMTEAEKYANLFNSIIDEGYWKIYFNKAVLHRMDADYCSDGGVCIIKKGEMCMVEPMIGGRYEKFNSNSGWSSGNVQLDMFSHWSWCKSDGYTLICDLQGRQAAPNYLKQWGAHVDAKCSTQEKLDNSPEGYFLLTDPAILSSRGRWGITDLGQQGIEDWFEL